MLARHGRCVRTDLCHKLEVGDRLMATSDIYATDNRCLIPVGTMKLIRRRDSDGDVRIAIDATKVKTVILYEDLMKLLLKWPSKPQLHDRTMLSADI